MKMEFSYNTGGVILRPRNESTGIISRFFARQRVVDIETLSARDRLFTFGLADLRALGDAYPGELEIEQDSIHLSHRLAAALDSQTAEVLGLPPLVDHILRTDVEGVLGTPSFRVRHEWFKNGQRQLPKRIGAILRTTDGDRRLPLWLLEAVQVAENFVPGYDDALQWETLARFRQALEPGVQLVDDIAAARVSMTDFLQGLEVQLADRFSITPLDGPAGADFDVLPFSGLKLDQRESNDEPVGEAEAELGGSKLQSFQKRLRTQGALPAYRLGEGSYLVIDRAAKPVLDVMSEMQRASGPEREAFIQNPRTLISQAIEEYMRAQGKLDGLTPEGEEEAIEAIAGPSFVETREYSDRVIGKGIYSKPDLGMATENPTTWLPEYFTDPIIQALSQLDVPALEVLSKTVQKAIDDGKEMVAFAGHQLPASEETIRGISARKDLRAREEAGPDAQGADDELEAKDEAQKSGPIVLQTKDNFEELQWSPKRGTREPLVKVDMPLGIKTPLKQHQIESFKWQVDAWSSGLPGILNADEQGLGKTLQTISFLRWLKTHMADDGAENRGPVLVVAPTSLLENWEAEVDRHLDSPGLGHLIKLYGSGLGGYKQRGKTGVETRSGEEALNFELLHEAISEGRGHRFWILTTYTTLVNYQHSLGRIPFSSIVFDEIQTIKNPGSLRSSAARAMRSDFTIGLTGTPIENTTVDLWAIMEALCPGALGTIKDFPAKYGIPDESNMKELHARVFHEQNGRPALAIRRLKETAARDLPLKSRMLHPRLMPTGQSVVYEEARLKLASGTKGAALKMLHHIRSVSVHPNLGASDANDDFIFASARLRATFEILRKIHAKRERALVFIEHRKMQYRFVELVRQEFGVNQIDLINGDTPIQKRQQIVDRFQRHLDNDGGFDLLVLGPKAAGTGLTLTAATHVIHLSRWWNPAVEEQCNDRIHRLGQTKPVSVHIPLAIHPGYREQSFDCLLQSLMTRKRRLASSALWPMGDTSEDAGELQKMVGAEGGAAVDDAVPAAMAAMFERDNLPLPQVQKDGSYPFE